MPLAFPQTAESFLQASWLIPLYPLVGALLAIAWSPAWIRRTGPRPVGYINILTTLLALVHSGIAFQAQAANPLDVQILKLSWLQVADLNLVFPLELSTLTLGATLVLTLLNLLVQIYAVGYLEMDWGWGRLYALLALFESGLTALVLCDSLFFSYILLEILTLGTYLIVGYWFNQTLVVTGARDAFLTKRVGDLILLMGLLALFPLTGTWSFSELGAWAASVQDSGAFDPNWLAFIGVALVAGPVSKCAQFPLHLWLDEAMEGPLPTTILRNSVVVATGAWVLVKLQPVIALSPLASGLAMGIGAVSALGGSLIAVAQIDAKRVLSYLTTTYMGLIFLAVGAGLTEAALLLVLVHAIASTVITTATGSVILSVVSQDLTQMGGLWSRRPVTGISFLIGMASFIALPPLGGFWAMVILANGLWSGPHSWLLAVLLATNAIACFALVRMFGLMFSGPRSAMTARAPEPIWLMVLPMAILAGLALHLPLVMAQLKILPSWAELNWTLAPILIWSTVQGGAIAAFYYVFPRRDNPSALVPGLMNRLLAYDFYTPKIYQKTAIAAVATLAHLTDWLDRYVVDGLVNFVGLSSLFSGEALKYGNSGKTQSYALTITFFVALIGLYMGWRYVPILLP